MDSLSQMLLDFVKDRGACEAGIATVETLEGGPPSVDLSYVLPSAKSAVVFAVPLDQSLIPPYLTKKDRESHEQNYVDSNIIADGIAMQLASFLNTCTCLCILGYSDCIQAEQPWSNQPAT